MIDVLAAALSLGVQSNLFRSRPPADPQHPGGAVIGAQDAERRLRIPNGPGHPPRPSRQRGVTLSLNIVTDTAANVTGGLRRDIANTHSVEAAADFDLDPLLGLRGTTMHFQASQFGGVGLQTLALGNSISPQQSWRPVREVFLSQLSVEHVEGRLNLAAGRMALNSSFFNSPVNCAFQSVAMCLTSYGPIQTQGITGFPSSSWALRGRVALTPHLYVQTGVYDYDPAIGLSGRNGIDFRLLRGPGVMIPVEIRYQTTFKDEARPRRYKVGSYFNTDGGTSPWLDGNGASAVLTGRPRALQSGSRVALYGLADRTISASQGGERNTVIFGRIFVNVGTATAVDWTGFAGFRRTGTFPGRHRDTVGAFVSNTRFSREQSRFWRDRRQVAGGTGTPRRDEIVAEINYGYVPVTGVRMMPNLQYIFNPDPGNAPRRTTDIKNALVLGLRVDVRVQDVLGAIVPPR